MVGYEYHLNCVENPHFNVEKLLAQDINDPSSRRLLKLLKNTDVKSKLSVIYINRIYTSEESRVKDKI